MTDPVFVVAAYAIVLGGIAAYAWSIARRVRAIEGHDGARGAAGVSADPGRAGR